MAGVRPRPWPKEPSLSVVDEPPKSTNGRRLIAAEVREDLTNVEKARLTVNAYRCSITTPAPFARAPAQASSNRVQDEIPAELEQMALALQMHGMEAALKQVAAGLVVLIERLGVTAVQQLDPDGQAGCRDHDEQVVMVGHQAVAEAAPAVALDDPPEEIEKEDVVPGAGEDRLLSITAGRDVVRASGDLDARGTWHELSLARLAPQSTIDTKRALRRCTSPTEAKSDMPGVRPRACPLGVAEKLH